MYELVYTSTPQGLLTGRSGFTTVALTEGFPPNLIAPVENLSGYKPLFPPGNENDNYNPVNFSCQQFRLGRVPYIVLSRISFAGLSYTGRSNVLAHHLLFSPEELDDIPGGAISVLRAPENFPTWSGNPRMLPFKKKINFCKLPSGGNMWQKLAGDRRWAAYTAECFRQNPEKSLSLAFDPLQISGADILELIAETAACLNSAELRHFAFSTYSYSSGISNPLFFRSYVNDSAQLGSIKRLDPQSVIQLGAKNFLPSWWQEEPQQKSYTPPPAKEEEPEELPIPSPVVFNTIQEEPAPAAQPAPPQWDENRNFFQPAPEEIQSREDQEENTGAGRYIILSILICVVLLLCGAVVWRVYASNKKTLSSEAISAAGEAEKTSTISDDSELLKNAAPRLAPPKSLSPAPVEKKTARETFRPAVKPPAAAPPQKTKEPPAPVTVNRPFGQLDSQELFKLYRSFYSGKSCKLPQPLAESTALELKISSVGGLKENIDLQKFVRGNRSRSVTICARKGNDSGLMMEWEPDKNIGKALNYQLSHDGFLKIRTPLASSDEIPRFSDVTQIIFIDPDGNRCGFDTRQIPRAVDEYLNKNARAAVKYDGLRVKFILHVPDAFLDFRKFYTISCDGRTLGGADIDSKEIVLKELDLTPINEMLRKRNQALNILTLQRSEYQKRKKAAMKTPRLNIPPAQRKKIASLQLKEFIDSARKDPPQEVEKKKSQLEAKLKQLTRAVIITTAEYNTFMKKINSYAAAQQQYRQEQTDLFQLKKNLDAYQNEFNLSSKALKENLKNLSPVFYKRCWNILENVKNPRPLDIAFFKKTNPNELRKDMKFEIIRKAHP